MSSKVRLTDVANGYHLPSFYSFSSTHMMLFIFWKYEFRIDSGICTRY